MFEGVPVSLIGERTAVVRPVPCACGKTNLLGGNRWFCQVNDKDVVVESRKQA
jgi:hypothetical protein